MYDLATGIYTADQIRAMLMSDREVWYEFDLFDKNDVPIGQVTATGSIDYNATAKIQRAANLQIVEERDIDFLSEKIQPVMCLKTPTGEERFPLGVFYMSSPSRQASLGSVRRDIECYDMTLTLSDDKFTSRYKAAAGIKYDVAILNILASAGIEDAIVTPTDKVLAVDIEFALGTPKLDAINSLLAAINYNPIYANQNGRLVCEPYESPLHRIAQAEYITDKKSVIFAGVREEMDVFNLPNKVVRYLETADRGVLISEVTNTDPTSPLSTVSRGRTIVDVAAVQDIADQPTLNAYTAKVMDDFKIYQKVIFDTIAMPNHGNYDCIYVVDSELDIAGKYIEESWHLDLTLGGHMRHTARKVHSL